MYSSDDVLRAVPPEANRRPRPFPYGRPARRVSPWVALLAIVLWDDGGDCHSGVECPCGLSCHQSWPVSVISEESRVHFRMLTRLARSEAAASSGSGPPPTHGPADGSVDPEAALCHHRAKAIATQTNNERPYPHRTLWTHGAVLISGGMGVWGWGPRWRSHEQS